MDHGRERAVVVVGAGPGGLAVSRELMARRIDHVVLERGEIGESWRPYYDGLVLHTGRHLSSLPGLPLRRPAPLFVPRDRFVRYLEDYAATMRLPVQTGAEVTSVRREGGRWHLATNIGPWSCQVLVVATGIAASPVIPPLPGLDEFRGRIRHSIEYQRPEPFRDRRVLVVGAGNSGGEIAAELATVAAPVSIAIRSGVVVVPREIAGIPSQYLGMLVRRLPRVLARAIVAMGTRQRARRLPPSLPQSTASPLDEIPLIGMHLPDAIAAGSVRVRPGVVEFTPEAVRFADGSEAPFDEVILATGFRAALEPFDGVQRDRRGFARRTGRVTSADQSDLFFVGHEYDASGGLVNIRRDAPEAAKRVEAALSAAAPGPPGRSSPPG
jgi:cation diffusion facilitator CzcD-associated flavoprotein CzcO